MRLAFQLLTLGILVGACAAPTDTSKEVAEVVAQLSLPEQLEAILKEDEKDKLVALLDKQGLTSCDLAIRNSELRATTVLELACSSGAVESVRYLVNEKKVDPNILGRSGWTPLMRAAYANHPDVVALLLKAGSKASLSEDLDGRHALHLVGEDAIHCIEHLLQAGALLDTTACNGETALFAPTGFGYKRNVAELIKAGAAIDIQKVGGETPLYYSVFCNQTATTAYLLAQGAKPNLATHRGETPLHYAALQGLRDEVELLLFYGADSTLPNSEGKTAEDVAESTQLRYYIQQFNARRDQYLRICDVFKTDNLTDLRACLLEEDAAYWQALNAEHGASAVSAVRPSPPSLLHLAIFYGAENCAAWLLEEGICQVNDPDLPGAPVLCWAALFDEPALAKLLLEKGLPSKPLNLFFTEKLSILLQ